MKINLHKIIDLENGAKKLVKNKDFKKAIKKYKQMLETIVDPDLHLKIVECYFEVLKNSKDKEYYSNIVYHINEAISLDENLRNDSQLLLQLSYSFMKLGYFTQAREILEDIFDNDTTDMEDLETSIALVGFIEYVQYKDIDS